ncbi:MAG: long-chain fatty acid transporter [Bacteroidetes bacterium]|jgi:long-chain fatty acid transport protein|nr:long-chain fatty acid transporter [Bacteroidota bacterium]
MQQSYTPSVQPQRTRLLASLLLLLGFCFLTANDTQAQGFGIFEQGTCASARGGTAAANPCEDGSSVYFNPAGLAGTSGWTFSGGVSNIIQVGDYTADDTGESTDVDSPVSVVPHFYAAYGATERLGAGLGVYVPFGLNTQWPADFRGALLGYDNNLQTIYIQPSVAYQLTDRIKVGGGLVVAVSSVELNQRLDLAQQLAEPDQGITFAQLGIPRGTPFAEATLDADPTVSIGGNFGIQAALTDRISVGARFTTPIKMEYEGEASFRQVATNLVLPAGNPLGAPAGTPLDGVLQESFNQGPLVTQGIETEITMPAQFVAGLSVQATERLNLMLDYQWTGWSTLEEVPLDFEISSDNAIVLNYGDSHNIRAGAEFAIDEIWTVRGGYVYNKPASPDETVTPLAPESERNRPTLGLGVKPFAGVELNLAYQFVNQNDRRGRTRGADPGEQVTTDLNDGLYSIDAHVIATTLTVRL